MDLILVDKDIADNEKVIKAIDIVKAKWLSNDLPLCQFEFKSADEVLNDINSDRLTVRFFAAIVSPRLKNEIEKVLPNNYIEFTESTKDEKLANAVEWVLTNYGKERIMTSGTFFTSDTHFYHDNIIKYCNRPFKNVDEMNAILIDKWNAKVKKDDVIWHLGDFCFGGKNNIKEIFPKLNGKINLVLGNHDNYKVDFYYDLGFHRVYDHPVLIQNFFVLSHEPIQWLNENIPMCNIFGHVHDNPAYHDFSSNSFCVCVERCNYEPVRWSEMMKKMKCKFKDEIRK